MPILVNNKSAYRNYEIIEKHEAGIKLFGNEVKALKEGKGVLTGSFIKHSDGSFFVIGFTIPQYSKAGVFFNYDPKRSRQLLLNKSEINSITAKVKQRGYTIIPLDVYTKESLIKLTIALVKGKTKADIKDILIKKQAERAMMKDITRRE